MLLTEDFSSVQVDAVRKKVLSPYISMTSNHKGIFLPYVTCPEMVGYNSVSYCT
jgi:hypothetical protein